MAIVTWGAMVSGVRGTIGGVTFSGNRQGPYVKAWAAPATRHGEYQVASRRVLSTNAQGWGAVSSAHKALWAGFAANIQQVQTNPFGVTYYLSGFQWYVKVNGWLASVGRGRVATPPAPGKPGAPTNVNVQALNYVPSAILTLAGSEFSPTYDLVLEMESPFGIGRAQSIPGRVLIYTLQVPTDGAYEFWPQIVARFGFIETEQQIWFWVYRQTIAGYRGAALRFYGSK